MTQLTHRTLHQMNAEFIFSLAHTIYAKTDQVMGIKQVSKKHLQQVKS